jgi:hypothetical protein
MTAMQHAVIDQVLQLPPEDVEKVLRFVETLLPEAAPATEQESLRGLFAHRGIDISAADIAAARKEAWANFPRDLSAE